MNENDEKLCALIGLGPLSDDELALAREYSGDIGTAIKEIQKRRSPDEPGI
jgi:hypothetical protein